MVNETRDRILTATNELFRRKGYNGTSLKDITTAATATTGSLYHFWPGGKDELTAEVLATSGEMYGQLFETFLDAHDDLGEAIVQFFEGGAEILETTDFIDPCPIGTVAREVASTNEQLRVVANGVFGGWIDVGTRRFERAGLGGVAARDLAISMVAAIEGGFILARTTRDAEPFRTAGRQFRVLIDATLSSSALKS